jgi:hypothetical protein
MPGFGDCQVEPNVTVKRCALKIIESLLPRLSKSLITQHEGLDDLMTSVIHAIEARRAELDRPAFQILKTIVDTFKDVVIDGANPLSLYESQFAIAIRSSFPSAIDAAADFHVSYLEMFMSNFEQNSRGCLILLDNYIKGLSAVVVRTAGYFAIASEICILAKKYEVVYDSFGPFLASISPLFSGILFDSIRLRTSGSDWSQLSAYRSCISPFYHNLLSATVWLRKRFPVKDSLSTIVIFSFFLLELTSSSESWRSFSAYAALNSLLNWNADEVDPDLLTLVLSSMCHVSKWNPQFFRPLVAEFLEIATSLKIQDEDLWVSLAYTALNGSCSARVLARILMSVRREIVQHSVVQFSDFVISELSNHIITQDDAICLVTILYDKVPEAVPVILSRLFTTEGFVAFKLRVVERAYNRVVTRVAIDRVSQFFEATLQPETMKVLGSILIKCPRIGVEIMKRGVLQKCVSPTFELCHGPTFFYFTSLVFDLMGDGSEVVREIAKAVLRVFAVDGTDRTKGETIAALAMILLNKCEEKVPGATLPAFLELGTEVRGEVNRLLQKYAAKKAVKKVSLVTFSPLTRRRTDDQWQSLGGDD